MPSVAVGIGIPTGWSVVHDAAKDDDLQSLINSIEAKKGMPIRSVDMKSVTGLTPLHVAAMHGSNLCIPYLVSMDADLTITDSRGRLAVHYAAEVRGPVLKYSQFVVKVPNEPARQVPGNHIFTHSRF